MSGATTLTMVRRGLALPLGLLASWSLAVHAGLIDHRLLPPVEDVVGAAFGDHAGELWRGLAASFTRAAQGYLVGCGAGLALGTLMGLSRTAERMVGPSFNAVRQVAVFAWIPLLTAWFGNGELAKIAFVSLAAFYPVVINTHEGVRNVPPAYREVARVFRLAPVGLLTRLVLPAAAPSILIGLQLALIYAWIATVGAEYLIGTGPGIGTALNAAREHFRMDVVLLGVVVIGLVGFVMNRGLDSLAKRSMRPHSSPE